MEDKKISELNPANLPLSGAEEVAVVQGGVTKKTTVTDFLNNFLNIFDLKEDKSNKGIAGGYVPLNGSTLIDAVYLPSSNESEILKRIRVVGWGDSLTAGANVVNSNYLIQLANRIGLSTTNQGVGGETSVQIKVRFDADPSERDYPHIFWVGRNNYASPNQVKSDIASMVASLGHTNYLVLSILNQDTPSEYIGQPNFITISTLNNDLSTLYGTRFQDVYSYLLTQGDGSGTDLADIANGVVPGSLRNDTIHLNALGYKKIVDFIEANGLIHLLQDFNKLLNIDDINVLFNNSPNIGGERLAKGYFNKLQIGSTDPSLSDATLDAISVLTFVNGATPIHVYQSATGNSLNVTTSVFNLINKLAGVAMNLDGQAGTSRDLSFNTNGVNRWNLRTTSEPESGANAGSNLQILPRSDVGSALTTAIFIRRNSGNVVFGGTIDNGFKLEAVGSARVTGQFTVGNGTIATNSINNGASSTSRDYTYQTNGSPRWIFRADGTPESGANAGSNFQIVSRDDSGGSIGVALFITRSNGDVIIGGSTPSGYKLDVLGNTRINGTDSAPNTTGAGNNFSARLTSLGSLSTTLDIGVNSTNSYTWIQSRNGGDYATNRALYINPNGGNVGIRTSTSSSPLSVGYNAGTTQFSLQRSSGTDNLNMFIDASNNFTLRNTSGGGDINFSVNTGGQQNNIYIKGSNSFVGIMTNTPTKQLDINGELRIRTLPTGLSTENILVVNGSGDVRSIGSTTFSLSNSFVDKEIPTGLINGVNTTYTLANTPTAGSEHVYRNGLLQESGAGNDYTISGSTITYLTAPLTGDKIRVTYRK